MDEQRPSATLERRFAHGDAWEKTVLVGGSDTDTALVSPYRLSVTRHGISLVDFFPKRVHRYDHSGRLVWRYGREGSGPDEFRQMQDLKVDAKGRAWVLDPANARVTVVSADGRPLRFTSLKDLGGHPNELVPLDGDRALVLVDRQQDPFVVLDSAGRVVSRGAFPARQFSELHHLATQLIVGSDPATGEWVTAYRLGDGFFPFRGTEWSGWRGWFVEEVPFPEVVTSRSGNTTSTRHREKPVTAARSVTLSDERIYVLFGGKSDDRNRLVDSYSRQTGEYHESYRLPERVLEVAWHDGGLYAIKDDPYPELAYFQLAGTARLP